ncbi:hypothetical protein [Streptomyces sp. MNP-20]|uniref:hypothetical protein n=1 Tax=Streptomyces sp. MNP-20 TaxID=2721165 RepID=UPI00155219C5|nr:hypothetical protein [Streptomyces sp. MNP-20]
MFAVNRPARPLWIAVTAAVLSLTACSSDGDSPAAQSAAQPSGHAQRERAGRDTADDSSTPVTRSKDGSLRVQVDGCKVYSQKAHGQIRWYTPGGSRGCEAWVTDQQPKASIRGAHLVGADKAYSSKWFTASSSDVVCVNNQTGQMDCDFTE